MKKKTRKGLIATLCCGLLATVAIGVTANVTAKADSVRVKPTGTNTATLTAPINDADLDTFKVQGASTRTTEPNGFRFLATIGADDLALIPNDAEFGMLLVPDRLLGEDELTEKVANVLVAPAKIDADEASVPENGLGYRITLMGETLDEAFPQNLYGTVLAARAYVKYTYEANGETITDYAYSAETLYRSIAYVASCELVDLENKGQADTNETSFLNQIIADQTQNAALELSASSIEVGETITATLKNATDGRNAFNYVLTASNETVAVINENGEIVANGAGTTEITASIGAKKISATLKVKGVVTFTDGNILYSTKDNTIFMPDGLLDDGETVVSAIDTNGEDYFNRGKWSRLALTDNEIKENTVRTTSLTIETSDGDLYSVNALSYAGVIDELSDFPAFFNNTAVASEFDATKTAVAPNVYGYYIVTKNLGTGVEELAFTQTEATDYNAANGFNGVLDGQGHKLQFTLTSGGLVGMILGNATIKNLAVVFTDNTSGHYGVFGYRVGGHTVIENCYIQRVNNPSTRTTIYGIIACTNKQLELRNTVVHGGTMSNTADWYSNMYISADSTNAFLIYARLDKNANTWGISANFTEVVDSNILASDLSSFDTDCWTVTTQNRISWKGMADMAVSVYDAIYVETVEENMLYSSADGAMILPEDLLSEGETIVNAYDTNGVDYYENDVWQNLALTDEENRENATRNTTVIITTSKGNYYQITAISYAGVIDELSDFPAFFNNTAVASEFDAATYPAVAPNVYGYYIVTKDLGTATDELTMTQTLATDYQAANGFNGVLDGQGHTLRFKLMSGGLVGLVLGNATIKNLGVIYEDASFISQAEGGGYGVFGYITNGYPVIDNCYIERTNEIDSRSSVYGIMARPNGKLILHNTVVYGYYVKNDCTWWASTYIHEDSTNAYLVNSRNANHTMAQNFTKVFADNIWEGSRHVALSEIENADGFDSNYWYKENGSLIWNGYEVCTVTWVNGETQTVETATKGGYVKVPSLQSGMFWSTTEDGSGKFTDATIPVRNNRMIYACSSDVTVSENALYSTADSEFFLPNEIGLDMSSILSITSVEGDVIYYENGAWVKDFALTEEQIQNNEVAETAIKIQSERVGYYVTVKSYAGVIDELNDFKTFFDNNPNATVPDVYGYYIVTKSLGTGSEELTLTQSRATTGASTNGFNGVLDGQGHRLRFKLMSGGLVGLILGEATIKNIAISFEDGNYNVDDKFNTGFGVFGYQANGSSVLENSYIERTNNISSQSSVFGLMARPYMLILRNTAVNANNTSNNSGWHNNMYISEDSTNAFLIYARSNASGWAISGNFDEISTSNTLTTDLSSFDTNCWTTTNNALGWKGMADMGVSSVGEVIVPIEIKKLAENGVTEYAIVLPSNADATLTTAKDELVSFFAEATGATLSLVEDGAYSNADAYISIGNTQMFATSGIALDGINSQGYHIQTIDNTVYINGNTSLGCLYGVYGLLGELFGYEQFSEDTYALNERSTVELPTSPVTESPDIEMRMPSNAALVYNAEYANRMGMAMGELDYVYRVGDYTNNGGAGWTVWHNALEILPPSYWKGQGKTNWFSDDGTQLCYTAHGNMDDYNAMVAQIAKIMEQTLTSSQITNKPDAVYYTLTSEDTDTSCTCSACQSAKSTYGSNAGAVIKLCNDVQATVAEWMNNNTGYKRDITLLFFAYNQYIDAPTAGTIAMREDVGVMYAISDYVNYYYDINANENASFKVQFDAWAELANASNSDLCVWTYSKNFQMYMLRADVYGENAFFNENAYQYFATKGVDLWFNQGASNGTTTLSTFEKLNGYIDSQMMWDSTQNVATLTDNWFNAMFGKGAEYMKSLYTAQNAKAREVYGTTKLGIPSVQFTKNNVKNILTEAVFNTWFGYIDSAKSAVNSDTSLTDAEKAKMIEHINEEWISIEFLYVYIYYSQYTDGLDGVIVDTGAAKAAFREVLGYDASTGTYAKDVVLLEHADSTLVEFIESDFTGSV